MGRTNQLPDNLPQLQNLIKRDPVSYRDEFEQQFRRYQSHMNVFLIQPQEESKELQELTTFIAQVSHCYPTLVSDFPQQLKEVLQKHGPSLNHDMRMNFCKCLILLRNKNLIPPLSLFELFFELFRCQDKLLRKTLYNFIVQDVKNLNQHHKNNKLNRSLQNFMYSMLSDNNSTAAKMSLDVMSELYHRQIWNDVKTVNVMSTACFSQIPKVSASALRFFLGQDAIKNKIEGESDSDDDGPTARDVITKYAVNKKTTRSKKKRNKALRVLHKHKKKMKNSPNSFSALQLLNDPQGFGERLYKVLSKSNERYEVRLMMMTLLSRLIGIHQLFIFSYYTFIQKYFQPHQRDVTKILLCCAQASHDLVPPEIIQPLIRTIVDNFVTERNSSEVIAVGLNAVREICARCPLAMNPDLLQDLVQYKTYRNKAVMMASKSLIQLFRAINPSLLHKKDRGKPTEAMKELEIAEYGQVITKDFVAGTEILNEEVEENNDGEDGWESCSNDSDDSDGSWQDVIHSDDDEAEVASDMKLSKEEQIVKAQNVSQMRLLTQEEFQKLRANQAMKEVEPASSKKVGGGKRKRVIKVDEDQGGEVVALGAIERVHAKRAHDKESRLATVLAGREGRESFGRKKKKLNPNSSTTNKQKRKNKPYMMVRQKIMKKSSGRSFREKQILLRNSLIKRAKQIK